MSRKVSDLHILLSPLCIEHLEQFEDKYPGILAILSFTWRSIGEQDALWRLGRNDAGEVVDPKKIVTYARGGQSWHNIERENRPASLAYDILLMGQDRKVLSVSNIMWNKLGAIGLGLGLDWGVISRRGRWDLGHFYLRGANRITLDEARSGIEPELYEDQRKKIYADSAFKDSIIKQPPVSPQANKG